MSPDKIILITSRPATLIQGVGMLSENKTELLAHLLTVTKAIEATEDNEDLKAVNAILHATIGAALAGNEYRLLKSMEPMVDQLIDEAKAGIEARDDKDFFDKSEIIC